MHRIASDFPTVVIAALLIGYALRPVSRARLDRFARRQELEITVANGALVIGYLATTRRWRVAGFLAGLLVSFGVDFTQRSTYQGGVAPLVGWFAGALVAEWHIEARRAGTARRSALLVARRFPDYLPRSLLAIGGLVWGATTALGLSQIMREGANGYRMPALIAAAAVITPLTWLIARRIRDRPQGVSADDVIAADDALRSRSLHVLLGCTLAVNGILAALIETTAQRSFTDWVPQTGAMVIEVLGALAAPAVGLLAATAPFGVRRDPLSGHAGAVA